MASSIRRTELSRATASGMNELGNRTVSRSGRIGTSPGTVNDRSAAPDWTRVLSSLMTLSLPPADATAGCALRRALRDRGLVLLDVCGRLRGDCAASAGWRSLRNRGEDAESSVQVDEKPCGPALCLPFALLGQLPRFLTVLATDREGQRPEASFRNLLTALEAVPVSPLIEAGECLLNLVQRLGLHLDQGQFDVVLDIRFGSLSGIENALPLTRGSNGADVAHLL